ncbi:hypothetical protein [Sinomicrobium sp. M5D2P9]
MAKNTFIRSKGNPSNSLKSKGDRMGWISVKKAIKVRLKDALKEGKEEKSDNKDAPLLVP